MLLGRPLNTEYTEEKVRLREGSQNFFIFYFILQNKCFYYYYFFINIFWGIFFFLFLQKLTVFLPDILHTCTSISLKQTTSVIPYLPCWSVIFDIPHVAAEYCLDPEKRECLLQIMNKGRLF